MCVPVFPAIGVVRRYCEVGVLWSNGVAIDESIDRRAHGGGVIYFRYPPELPGVDLQLMVTFDYFYIALFRLHCALISLD